MRADLFEWNVRADLYGWNVRADLFEWNVRADLYRWNVRADLFEWNVRAGRGDRRRRVCTRPSWGIESESRADRRPCPCCQDCCRAAGVVFVLRGMASRGSVAAVVGASGPTVQVAPRCKCSDGAPSGALATYVPRIRSWDSGCVGIRRAVGRLGLQL